MSGVRDRRRAMRHGVSRRWRNAYGGWSTCTIEAPDAREYATGAGNLAHPRVHLAAYVVHYRHEIPLPAPTIVEQTVEAALAASTDGAVHYRVVVMECGTSLQNPVETPGGYDLFGCPRCNP